MNTLRRASGLSALSLHYCQASPGVATRHAEVRALRVARTLVFAAFALLRTQGLSMLKFVPGQPASLAAIVCMSLAGATQSVWDGVYTAEQARRGQPIYNKHCASCHGEQLTGGEDSPPLTGGAFLANWNGLTVGDLFERIRVSMPTSCGPRLPRILP